ncbi:MAG: DNA polymerase III subunit delta [Lachnospiraceae bacterium]|nr:DNA polymerase III subunit delta [Lachnospiraceae bacterium]
MQRLKEDIKNKTFHKLYLLYGEEDYLKKLYRDSLKKAVLEGSDDMNYSYFEGKDTDISRIKETAETLPFFSDYRLITIENSGFLKSASTMADYLPDMPESAIIVFVEKEIDKRNKLYKYINKNGITVEMKQMGTADTRHFIGIQLKENNKQMRESTADYFLQQTGGSLSNIINEIDKLVSYTYGRNEITIEDIDAVCCIQITGRIFQMIDYAAMGKLKEALGLYNDLLELRESPMSILYLVTRQFNILLQIKAVSGLPRNEIASKIQIPPFATGKYITQANRFKSIQLKELLDECAETEYKYKRGLIDAQIGVEILLLKMAQN